MYVSYVYIIYMSNDIFRNTTEPSRILDLILVISVPADGLAPTDARSQAGTVGIVKFDAFPLQLVWLSVIVFYVLFCCL